MIIHAGYGQTLLLADTQNIIPSAHMIPVTWKTMTSPVSICVASASQSKY